MSRLVLVSFAFLGWGFYELSGGDDFTTPQAPDPPETAIIAAQARSKRTETTAIAAPLVTRTSINQRHKALARDRAALQPEPVPPQPPVAQSATAEPGHNSPVEMAMDPGASSNTAIQESASTFPAEMGSAGLRLASLEEGLGGGLQVGWQGLGGADPLTTERAQPLATEFDAAETDVDVDTRSIRAARVNMRQGPGTIYPIITRLMAGDEVVVMEDSGTGWLHLRTMDNAHFGWIAASLVSKKAP